MATLTLTLNCSTLASGTAQIVATASLPVVIPSTIFLFKVGGTPVRDSYAGIATPYEILTYPAGRDPAYNFYRVSTATIVYDTIAEGAAAKAGIQAEIQLLLNVYDDIADFVGESVYALESV